MHITVYQTLGTVHRKFSIRPNGMVPVEASTCPTNTGSPYGLICNNLTSRYRKTDPLPSWETGLLSIIVDRFEWL